MRKFYPGGVQTTVSQEYLLYDLSKTSSQNRAPGIIPNDRTSIGRSVYPLGQRNLPFDNIGLPEDQVHEFRSTSFFWAPGSSAVIFADSVQNALSLVLITIGDNGRTASYVHPIPSSWLCRDADGTHPAALSNVPFQQLHGPQLQFQVELTSTELGCAPRVWLLQIQDFTLAPTETHAIKTWKAISS